MKKSFLVSILVLSVGSSISANSWAPVNLLSSGDNRSLIEWNSVHFEDAADGDTLKVRFDGKTGTIHSIRLAGASAPEYSKTEGNPAPCQDIAKMARQKVFLNKGEKLWIGLGPTGDSKHLPFHTTIGDRLLGYVWIDPADKELVQIELVHEGLARLDVHADQFFGVFSRLNEFSFSTLYAGRLIEEQIQAAKTYAGWWGLCDPFKAANLAIAAINFWDETQIVYIINRGEKDLKLANYALRDKGNNRLLFTPNCELAAGQELEIRIKNEPNSEDGSECVKEKKGKLVITWRIKNEEKVWNLSASASKSKREIACLMRVGNINDKGACTEDSKPGVPGLCYVYQYPPDDGNQAMQEQELNSDCN